MSIKIDWNYIFKLAQTYAQSKRSSSFWIVLFFTLGLALRLLEARYSSLGFDQVQILENVSHILSGDLTLIGPRTGPAQMFTGPLIYYLTVPFYALFGIWSVAVVPIFIAGFTGFVLWFLSRKYLDGQNSLLLLYLLAASPFLVHLDSIFWNPNLSLLAFSLVFFALLSEKSKKIDYILIFIGSFLGYQAHFSGLLTSLLVLVVTIKFRRHCLCFLSSVLGLFLSLVPTILFDMRNGWLNLNGLLNLVQSRSVTGVDSLSKVFTDFIKNSYILLES